MDSKNKYLIVLAGPTAVGKTAVGIELAKALKSEIISIDSRQVYKELKIGTAKPDESELAQVKHYFIDSHSIHDEFNAAKFEKEALELLDSLFLRADIVVGVGGSGLYVNALCDGFDDIPEIEPNIRTTLNNTLTEKGIDFLKEQLRNTDPSYFDTMDTNNPQRIIRALEVSLGSGKPYSTYRTNEKAPRPFNVIKIGLDRDRKELYERIDKRMDIMIANGLFEEAETFYPFRHLNALQTVGYKEIFEFLDGNYDREKAIELLKRNSRRYAKRQLTWFRKDLSFRWFHPEDVDEIINFVVEQVSK